MAKAIFHKTQRVFVKPVGTWAHVERVIPHWVKDVDEPLRVTYDVGLGREFAATELISEANATRRDGAVTAGDGLELENWRIFRMKNRWQASHEASHHPFPGTFPVVVTDEGDWGGWRVPGAEYDRDPARIEHQARMVMNAPAMMRILRRLVEYASDNPHDLPDEIVDQAKRASGILRHIYEVPTDNTVIAAE